MANPTAAPALQGEVGLKERFFRYFQHEVTALQEQMARLDSTAYTGGERNDAVDHCLAGIDRLSHEVKDASSYIPAYDQRTYSEAIKALSEKLQNIRDTFNPPKKFQFKTARKNPSAISLSDAAELAKQNKLRVPGYYSSDISTATSSFAPTPLDKLSPSEEKREQELIEKNEALGAMENEDAGASAVIRKPSFSNASSVTISNHSGLHIILPTSASHATSSGTVSNLRHCVVDLSPPTTNGGPFASLVLKNIKTSLIVCGRVSGPIHITGIEDCVVVTACRQFRMHGSKNVDVYLHCSSRPIIEDCEQIRFAPLPETYSTPEISTTANQWDQIDDFKWLKSEPSPHYSILSEEDRVSEGVWKDTVPGGHNVSLDDVLRAVTVLH
ncbi:TBCC-domain-containing protein [Trematosphaeria pertusa]|uniref:TBCC-domain-containing protein n=1 Tax=Trematosphaeria pertusa TaxID=390896 RepID=A0A6A6IQ29_9PLEO|nr:TBCC-domain-containing protein [Trematosphaeria pertusa]KAF2252645.1 TBCC-domain-containing protein [Trematosphaeria pertusa]